MNDGHEEASSSSSRRAYARTPERQGRAKKLVLLTPGKQNYRDAHNGENDKGVCFRNGLKEESAAAAAAAD